MSESDDAVRVEQRCDFRYAHDLAADRPMGDRCVFAATHRIEWEDGRHSFGCDAHLVIEESATVRPAAIVPLEGARST